jgi:hypothetical protein
MYILHVLHVTGNSSFCTTHKSSVNTGFAEQIMPTLRILCYNSGLMTAGPHYIASARTAQKTPFQTVSLLGDVVLRANRTENAIPVLRAQLLLR